MALAQLSPPSLLANPSHVNPTAASEHQTAPAILEDQAMQSVKKVSTDTVTLSSYAVKRASTSR